MKAGGPIKKVKKMAKGGAADYNFGIPLNGLPMRPTNGNTDISKNQMGTNPTMKVGGATDEKCWPGKPGCGHSRANRVNNRRSAANKAAPVVKKILGAAAGAGAAIGAYAKNIGGIKDKIQSLKQQKMGGTIRKMAIGGYPPDEGERRAEINRKLKSQKNNSKNTTQNNNQNSQNNGEKNYKDMSRKDFRAEKRAAKREAKINSIKSGQRLENVGKIADAISTTANAVNTIVGAASTVKGMTEKQKRGGAVKKMAKGGSLKPVPAGKVGLSKLPTAVRNKMGYMKKGGSKKK